MIAALPHPPRGVLSGPYPMGSSRWEARSGPHGSPRPSHPSLPWSVLVSTILVGLLACGKGPAPEVEKAPDLATVEVTAAPDAAYSTAGDKVEARPSPNAMAGALPDGFPADIPVYRPSSLIDFAARPEGGSVVVFAAPASPAAVSSALRQKLRAAGWLSEGTESSGRWAKNGRRLRLVVEESAAGARIRVEF